MAAMTTPAALVEILNRVFSEFDYSADKFNLEKIKTIGDAYMVVAGIPTPQKVHVELMALMALEMCDMVMELNKVLGMNLSVRIGMASVNLPMIFGVMWSIPRREWNHMVRPAKFIVPKPFITS